MKRILGLAAVAAGLLVAVPSCTTTGAKATATPRPTNTQVPPTAVPTASPTNTSTAANTPTPSATPAATSPPGFWFLLGGNDGSAEQALVTSAQVGAGATLTWNAQAPLPTPVNVPGGAASGTHVFAIGGVDGTTTNFVDNVYSAASSGGTVSSWTSQTVLPDQRAGLKVFFDAPNSLLVALGGFLPNPTPGYVSVDATVYHATVSAGTITSWQTSASLPSAHTFGAAAYANGYVYAISGIWCPSSCSMAPNVYYGQVTSSGVATWTTTTALPQGLRGHHAAVEGGYLYVVGASGSTFTTPVAYSAPINTNGTLGAWTTRQAPADAVIDGALTARGGRLYLVPGVVGGAALGTTAYTAAVSSGVISSWTTAAQPATALYYQGSATQ